MLLNLVVGMSLGAVVGAGVISSVIFGLIYLPTGDWNLGQCLVVIGTARMVLTCRGS